MKSRQKIALIIASALLIIIAALSVFLKLSDFSLEWSFATGERHATRQPRKAPILTTDLYLWTGFFATHTGDNLKQVRSALVQKLVAQWFSGFVGSPYEQSGYNALTASGQWYTYIVNQPLSWLDALDLYLSGIQLDKIKELKISKEKRSQWSNIYLFKTTKDLQDLWYTVVSYRTRMNKDEGYRRTNISQAFKLLKYVKVLNPGEELLYLRDIQYDGRQQKNYLNWYAIIENDEIKVYGGWICGSSTAVYQGIVTNKALQPTALRSHSKWFKTLYTSYINGQLVTTPWIDSAIYDGAIDLHVKNISNHPIVIVANYDGALGSMEENFSLWFSGDQGSIEFVSSYRTQMSVPDDAPLPEVPIAADSFDSDWIRGWNTNNNSGEEQHDPIAPTPPAPTEPRMKTIYGWCYTRIVNGEQKKSCYREIK